MKIKDWEQLLRIIRVRNLESGLTGTALAAKSGLTQATVSRILKSKQTPSIDRVLKVCKALDIKLILEP